MGYDYNKHFDRNDTVARLMAAENITVTYRKCSTASFNLKTRELIMPFLDCMDDDVSDMFIGHEVGHALFTPLEGWHDSLMNEKQKFKGTIYKGYLNVVEDARIERLIQKRYPGLRKSFVRGYRILLNSDWFRLQDRDINTLNLIDRINIHFKCGKSMGIRFSSAEQVWVDEITSLTTWAEVEDLVERLFAWVKENPEPVFEEEEEPDASFSGELSEEVEPFYEEPGDSDEDEDEGVDGTAPGDSDSSEEETGEDEEGDPTPGASGESDSSEEETGEDSGDAEGEEIEDGDDASGAPAGGASGSGESEPVSEEDIASDTDEMFREALEELITSNDAKVPVRFRIPQAHKLKDILYPYKKVIRLINDQCPDTFQTIRGEYKNHQSYTKPMVNGMIKTFLVEQRASAYSRIKESKTGVIDPVRISNYMFTDDVFRRNEEVPEGQSHGLIFYLDWSGSMAQNPDVIRSVVQQTIAMTDFCRKMGIPFRVYAFSNNKGLLYTDPTRQPNWCFSNREENTLYAEDGGGLTLLEFLSSDMSRSDYVKMASWLYVASYNSLNCSSREVRWRVADHVPYYLSLAGTPMREAMIYAPDVFKKFQEETRVEKTATFWFTDGVSAPLRPDYADDYDSTIHGGAAGCLWTAPNGKEYWFPAVNRPEEALVRMYEDVTGSPTICFRLMETPGDFVKHCRTDEYRFNGAAYRYSQTFADELKKEWKEAAKLSGKGFIELSYHPYTKFYAMNLNTMKYDQTNALDGAKEGSRASLRSAFKRQANKSSNMLGMLTKVVEFIA